MTDAPALKPRKAEFLDAPDDAHARTLFERVAERLNTTREKNRTLS
jgi:hypothetical protein